MINVRSGGALDVEEEEEEDEDDDVEEEEDVSPPDWEEEPVSRGTVGSLISGS